MKIECTYLKINNTVLISTGVAQSIEVSPPSDESPYWEITVQGKMYLATGDVIITATKQE